MPLFIALLTLNGCNCNNDDNSIKIVSGGTVPEGYNGTITRILEDNVHSTKQNSTIILRENNFQYSQTYGYSRLFSFLNNNGYKHDRLVNGKLTSEILKNYDILFLNLMDNDKPEFKQNEIDAVTSFIQNGGGLFVIADHTNVYKHAEMTNPLLAPYGITIRYEIAADTGIHSVSGIGWILVNNHSDHKVNSGITEYSLQTGGTIDGPGGLGYISTDGWGDFWDPNMADGYYGNWSFDDCDPISTDSEQYFCDLKGSSEVRGPLSVSQAVEYHSGRVFVFGDQNSFGDAFLYFADNNILAINAFEWLAKRDNETPPLRNRKPQGLNIRIDTRADNFNMASGGASCRDDNPDCDLTDNGYFSFYVNLHRNEKITAHATRNKLAFTPDAFLVAEPKTGITTESYDELDDVIAQKGQIILIVSDDLSAYSKAVISHIGVDLNLTNSENTAIDIQNDTLLSLSNVTTTQALHNKSEVSLESCVAVKCPDNAVLSAIDENDKTCDLICSYNVGEAKFLLLFTGKHFRRSALRWVHTTPKGTAYNNFLLQMHFMDLLLQQ